MKVLLVEDSKFPGLSAERALTAAAGYQVISTADGEQGLRLARELTPALILLDVMLPKMSGLCFNSKSVQFPARSMPLEH